MDKEVKKGRIKLKKTKDHHVNKTLNNIEETLNDINNKINELRDLDKGSKFFIIIGWLMLGLGGAGVLTFSVMFRDDLNALSYLWLFLTSSGFILLMIAGFMFAHKGLTGDWM